MLTCWRQVYGTVAIAVSPHLAFAFTDIEPFFEHMLGEILTRLGLDSA
jgi:hypothetical protein